MAIKTKTNDLYIIFLLKKNIRSNIIKTILEYLLIAVSDTLKKWKVVIILVEQGYRSTEGQENYKTETRTIYEERGAFMDIGKSKYNYDKNKKPIYFNSNIYKYIVKNCQKPRKEKKTKKYYKCDKVGYLAKNCMLGQKIKNGSV